MTHFQKNLIFVQFVEKLHVFEFAITIDTHNKTKHADMSETKGCC